MGLASLSTSSPVHPQPSPEPQRQPFVITTPNRRKLEQAVGSTSAIEIGGCDYGSASGPQAVEAAADESAAGS
jgi:hypothetical protein